ncbi:carbonic anhydrase 2 isoform X2 [Ricinus communis]|uniref:carbonic anhydrase 2 isoform X2 n=1 Tax=Ricinus communis TaxID=3988 RepID=UPI00201AB581|nr:carbonic anhydrase 2 isoform X2 [Ricinus communis]
MVWLTRSRTYPILTTTVAALRHRYSSVSLFAHLLSAERLPKLFERRLPKLMVLEKDCSLRTIVRLDASISSLGLVQELTSSNTQNVSKTDGFLLALSILSDMLLNRKEAENFKNLAELQSPKFMVIACVDSRVCPSNVLGFQPGEAFMVRNVANIVPALENRPTETTAALEFAVNTLEVENIFVIGHSNCAGIQALMSMKDDNKSSFVEKWVATAKIAKLRTKTDAGGLSFDQQCKHCEKESINWSLLNLLTYPWIEERVKKETLSIHGGYYDFLNCTFEKWTLDFNGSSVGHGGRFSTKATELWS